MLDCSPLKKENDFLSDESIKLNFEYKSGINSKDNFFNSFDEESFKQDPINFKLNYDIDVSESKENQIIFFRNLEKHNINFSDGPPLLKDLSNLNSICEEYAYIPLLCKKNYYIYLEMKKLSIKGKYPNLKILELNNESCIQATKDIEMHTLLFEVGGEVLSKSQLVKIFTSFKNPYWCYYNYLDSSLNKDNKIIVLNKIGNIAFFLQSSKNYNNNIELKCFKLYNEDKIVLLAFSCKKIYKDDILIYNNKLIII